VFLGNNERKPHGGEPAVFVFLVSNFPPPSGGYKPSSTDGCGWFIPVVLFEWTVTAQSNGIIQEIEI